jgi:hypothetical protein
MSCGVFGDWAGCVWWHILENPTQSLDNVFIIDFITGHPRRVVVARILVPEGVARHERLHPPLHKAEGHVFDPQPGFSQSLDLLQQFR